MLTVIGLLVAVYGGIRLLQVPLEMAARREEFLGASWLPRWIGLACLSAVGVLALAFLTLLLLIQGEKVHRALSGM